MKGAALGACHGLARVTTFAQAAATLLTCSNQLPPFPVPCAHSSTTGQILGLTALGGRGAPIFPTPWVDTSVYLDLGNGPTDLKGALWTTSQNEVRQWLSATNETEITALGPLLPAGFQSGTTGGIVLAQGPNATNKCVTTNYISGTRPAGRCCWVAGNCPCSAGPLPCYCSPTRHTGVVGPCGSRIVLKSRVDCKNASNAPAFMCRSGQLVELHQEQHRVLQLYPHPRVCRPKVRDHHGA